MVVADNATVSDLVGLTLWKYVEMTKSPVKMVRGHDQGYRRIYVAYYTSKSGIWLVIS